MMFKQLCRLQRYTFLHDLPNVYNTFLHELSSYAYTFLHELSSYTCIFLHELSSYYVHDNRFPCLIREKVVTFRMVKLNMLLSIFLSLNELRIFNFITIWVVSDSHYT